jgi:hypothetical protein
LILSSLNTAPDDQPIPVKTCTKRMMLTLCFAQHGIVDIVYQRPPLACLHRPRMQDQHMWKTEKKHLRCPCNPLGCEEP